MNESKDIYNINTNFVVHHGIVNSIWQFLSDYANTNNVIQRPFIPPYLKPMLKFTKSTHPIYDILIKSEIYLLV